MQTKGNFSPIETTIRIMNRDHAKFHLQAWHSDSQEETPEVREALALLETDPVLADWWEKEQAFDNALANAVAKIPVPKDLRNKLLECENGQNSEQKYSVLRFPRILAYAASLAILLGLTILFLEPKTMDAETDVYQFLEKVPEWMEETTVPQKSSDDLKALLNHLDFRQITLPEEIQSAYGPLKAYGARIENWENKRIGVLHLKDSEGQTYRLFMVASSVFIPEKEITNQPGTREVSGLSVLTWRDDELYYAFTEAK